MKLSQKQIGRRITAIRKMKGFSQDELAKSIHISRPSLAQIELGNRGIDILEMQQLSFILRFSLDDILSKDFTVSKELKDQAVLMPKNGEQRISVPKLQVEKFKNVLLYILEKCGGKPNVGETVLYKLLYFSDFNYYELYEEQLTGARYRKLPYGPVPEELDSIIKQMMDSGKLQRIKTQYHDHLQVRYLPLEKADLTKLRASEKEVLDRVIEQMSDWSAGAISKYAHNDFPWKVTSEGKEINYELALYRDLPYSVRAYEEVEENE